ncbi:MAG: 3-deoxy-7-phosphoheptulonate synthase [Chloroflexota bacterium]
MIVIMKPGATMAEKTAIIARAEEHNCKIHLSDGSERTIIGVIGNVRPMDRDQVERMPGVERVVPILKPFKVASREFKPNNTIISVGDYDIGGGELVIMAGPCAVESRSQILETAEAVKAAGAHMLRGGAFKPRSSPYSFQGLGEQGLKYLAEARELTGMPIITEVMEPALVPMICEYADILQIGARNMQNFALLHAVGKSHHPVMLKRGMSSLIEEWLMSAEYILSHGNTKVMMCERGIRTIETATRFTFDVNAIPVLKQWTHLPVIADPSHGTGKWEFVAAIARAAVAAGADGLIIEVHPRPDEAMSDGVQSLKPEKFARLVQEIKGIAAAIGMMVAETAVSA